MGTGSNIRLSAVLVYTLAAVSAALAIYMILFCASDFVDPNSSTFGYLTLSRSQILTLDSVAIVIHLVLLYFLYFFIKRRRPAMVFLICVYIWFFAIAQIIFEQSFALQLAQINQYFSCVT